MAHEIDETTGRPAMAYAGDRGTPWHGLGVALPTVANSQEMTEAAGLTSLIIKTGPLYGGPEGTTLIDDRRSIYREDTGAVLGVASNLWTPWQVADAFAFADSLIADGSAAYETAMSLKGGKLIAATLRLPEDVHVGDDLYRLYMLVMFGNDGKTGITIAPTNVRVVCFNTLTQSLVLAEKERQALHISHLPGIDSRLDQARKVLNITTEASRKMAAVLEQMLDTKVSDAKIESIEEQLFGPAQVRSAVTKGQVETFRLIHTEEQATQGKSAYSLLQAITGYADHALRVVGKPEQRVERRFISATSGSGAEFKAKGLAAVRQLVKA